MRPIRFCFVSTFYGPASFGGDGVQVQRLARLLASAGHKVTVVTAPKTYRVLGGPATVNGQADDAVKVVPIDTGGGRLGPLTTYMSGRPMMARSQLERALDGPFDVLHFHNPSLIGGPAVLGMGDGTLRLYTAHEQWLLCATHVLWKNKREVCERPTCWRCSVHYRRPPQLWRSTGLMERSLAHLDALIVPSRTSGELHARFADLVRIEHIPHFVPHPGPDPGGGVRDGRPYFLFVGRHEPIKGAAALIEAFRHRGEELLLAGRGPLEGELRRSASGSPHIRFLGWQERQSLDSLYRGALGVLAPTLGHESFGLVPVEAFACGTPAVVHGFGALAELIDQSGAGMAYRSRRELGAALDRLAQDGALRAELGARGRQAYLERWTPEAHLARYMELVADRARRRGARDLEQRAEAARASPGSAGA